MSNITHHACHVPAGLITARVDVHPNGVADLSIDVAGIGNTTWFVDSVEQVRRIHEAIGHELAAIEAADVRKAIDEADERNRNAGLARTARNEAQFRQAMTEANEQDRQ